MLYLCATLLLAPLGCLSQGRKAGYKLNQSINGFCYQHSLEDRGFFICTTQPCGGGWGECRPFFAYFQQIVKTFLHILVPRGYIYGHPILSMQRIVYGPSGLENPQHRLHLKTICLLNSILPLLNFTDHLPSHLRSHNVHSATADIKK